MMYEYRILFPRVGSVEIRRELAHGRTVDQRRRTDGCVRPDQRTPKERS
jgi:hypothetical protein